MRSLNSLYRQTSLPSLILAGIVLVVLPIRPVISQEEWEEEFSEIEEESVTGPAEEEDLRIQLEGDVIYFKFGEPMTGVQVIRSTPQYYYIETAPGVEPLRILRKLVERVEYDDIDPLEQRRRREQQVSSSESIVSGEQLAPALRAKLTAPIDNAIQPFENRDLVQVIDEIVIRMDVAIEIDESLRNLPAEERLWSVPVTPATTLMGLLQEHVRRHFPQLRIDFQFDKVVLSIPPPEGEEEAPPAATPPPTPPPPIFNP